MIRAWLIREFVQTYLDGENVNRAPRLVELHGVMGGLEKQLVEEWLASGPHPGVP